MTLSNMYYMRSLTPLDVACEHFNTLGSHSIEEVIFVASRFMRTKYHSYHRGSFSPVHILLETYNLFLPCERSSCLSG